MDLAELRVDHLLDSEKASAGRLPGRAGLPVILTVRRGRDGGRFQGSEADRIALLQKLAAEGFGFIDIEEDLQAPVLEAQIRKSGARIVRSLHDFAGVPAGLSLRVSRLARSADEIPKAAVTPTSSAQLVELLEIYSGLGNTEHVVLGMGDIGFPSRVLAPFFGTSWCYASATAQSVAPGQVTPAALEEVYRYRAISASTAIYGVIGSPVMHSRSPLIHNRGFAALGIDAVYLPFQVPDLEGFWKAADVLHVRGLSVTAPHKEAVLGRNVLTDGEVKAVGACNTLTRPSGKGRWNGTNTDAEGFLGPLRALFGGTIPSGLGATVIGAGGAARSVVAALKSVGARVLVLNRTVERARALAEQFKVRAAGIDEGGVGASRDHADLIVQTTSVGMAPHEDADPVPGLGFGGREIVYELVYAPEKTPLVRRALSAGCRVLYGRQMLVAQALRQFHLFTGAEYPPAIAEKLSRGFD